MSLYSLQDHCISCRALRTLHSAKDCALRRRTWKPHHDGRASELIQSSVSQHRPWTPECTPAIVALVRTPLRTYQYLWSDPRTASTAIDSSHRATLETCALAITSSTRPGLRHHPRTGSYHQNLTLSKVRSLLDSRYSEPTIRFNSEQANAIFNSILHSEVTPPSPRRPHSPTRPIPIPSNGPPSTPKRRRLFTYNSPSTSNPNTPTRRLDTPTDEAYSMSPVRAESRQLLESPRRQLRSVCKTPYRVLDAPELADDFYLNLVDWSSTNVLGVGLGSCVYLWTAHNAQVSKLCDLAESNDTISSVSWVQKVS